MPDTEKLSTVHTKSQEQLDTLRSKRVLKKICDGHPIRGYVNGLIDRNAGNHYVSLCLSALGNPKTRRRVIGDLIQVRNVTEAMSQLDYIEGFYGFGDPHSLFCRRIVPVELSNGKIALAWVYAYNRSVTEKELIKSGDWVKR